MSKEVSDQGLQIYHNKILQFSVLYLFFFLHFANFYVNCEPQFRLCTSIEVHYLNFDLSRACSYVETDEIAQMFKILFVMINLKTKFDGNFLFDWYKS